MLQMWRLSLVVACSLIGGLPVVAQTALSLDARVASVLPTPQEDLWLTIPWRSNLMQARLEAQRLNRPLFLWVMNGNPMGCT